MADRNPFEMPQQMRDLAERNLAQGRAAYSQFMDAVSQMSSMWLGAIPSNDATSTYKVAQERSLHFAKQNADAYFAFAAEMAGARDIQDALAIQSRYAQSQIQTLTLQAQELGRLSAQMAQMKR